MIQYIKVAAFLQEVFDDQALATKAAPIVSGILAARSPRLSDIAQHMPGQPAANYKAIQRFLAQADPKAALVRLFQSDAPFVIGDPTEMPRPGAYKTEYVGTLKDGETKGFWLLLLATPYRGRALPFSFVTYSSRTIAQEQSSRNLYHWQAFDQIKALLGDKPLVLDREFSYLELLEYFSANQLNFVIRLQLGSHPPVLLDAQDQRIKLDIWPGKKVTYRELRYRGKVKVQVIGLWRKGAAEPVWVMTNLEPEQGLQIYLDRMKVEQSFKDLKSLLGLDKLMNKRQHYLEQMAALTLLAYTIGLLVGEAIRDELFGSTRAGQPTPAQRKWQRYSGLFILLKRKLALSAATLRQLVAQVHLRSRCPAAACPNLSPKLRLFLTRLSRKQKRARRAVCRGVPGPSRWAVEPVLPVRSGFRRRAIAAIAEVAHPPSYRLSLTPLCRHRARAAGPAPCVGSKGRGRR